MPFQLAPARQASKKLIAKLKPVWLGKGMRSIGRGASRIPLGPVITVVQTTGNVGSAVPYLQGVSSLVVSILQRADTVKRNREECEELAWLAKSVVSTVGNVTRDVPEDELDEKMKEHITELERNMTEIMKTMRHLQDKPVWRRFVRKDKHSDALAKHKQGLTHALAMFQTKELVAIRHAQHRDHVQTAATLQELQTAGVIYSSTALIFHRLFF
ncbi:uncharacterized protein TRAVEDRAFT_69110 [Trametes versicolor FP-101664 SS1]|uniref:uncharacterized protein n=1 Tax=Trametes versicolor (strain FP-101664) TaxID=717944 RepID=UPI0004622550|nr:uncharacterized protein TRAVEDRAFT_69110 [Trametes versicolor FP-101664 SS1]EIW62900.1 hypothetical protein TRAVEDRAFT_69110 [Trametes versicolor FP-101664 SS1]